LAPGRIFRAIGAILLAFWLAPALAALDLNSATRSELEAVPGIGPVKAVAILDYRLAHGPYRNLDELQRVRGLGPASVARLKPYLSIRPRADMKPAEIGGHSGPPPSVGGRAQ